MPDVKNNLRGTAAPQLTDDSSAGYSKGSTWYWNGLYFGCRDATVGAAVWHIMGQAQAWPSATYAFPDNFNGQLAVVTPATSADILAYFPFYITRPFNGAAVWCSGAGSTGAAVQFGLYRHDWSTMKPGARVANCGNVPLTSTGLRAAGFTAQDVFGLHWVSVNIKLIGLTTAPTVTCMAGANGRHVHRGDGTELSNLLGLNHYSTNDTYNTSPVNPAASGSAINRNAPCPILLAA